jgi:hypothetical protein
MTIQDPTVTRAELAIEEAELIDGGPAVSWGAIIAGALSAAALSFVLLAIGAAFGLSVTSPWDFTGRQASEAAAAAGIGTAIFLIVVHAITSGVGGYLALGAASLNAAGQAAGAAAPALMDESGRGGDTIGYFIDTLFRPAAGAPAATGTEGQAPAGGAATAPMTLPGPRLESDVRMEREEIAILRVALDGEISSEDRTHIAQIVAGETGLPQAEAEQRVDQMIERAKAARAEAIETAKRAADAARQAGMSTALWAAVAMLAGAFAASLAATWGGRARDL